MTVLGCRVALKRIAAALMLAVSAYGGQLALAVVPTHAASRSVVVASTDSLLAPVDFVSPGSSGPNHVKRLDSDQIRAVEKANQLAVVASAEGVFQATKLIDGTTYLFTAADAALPDGTRVVGLSTQKVVHESSGWTFPFGGVMEVSAATVGLGMCSYTYNDYYGNQRVHICQRDLGAILAMIAFQFTLIIVFGGVVGAIVVAFLGLLLAIGYWYFQNPDGSIDFTVPAWTISPPPGGWSWSSGSWGTWQPQYAWYYDQYNVVCTTC